MADFESGLFGCFDDLSSCLLTYFCHYIQMAKSKAMVDGRECTFCDCLCMSAVMTYFTRQQIRSKFAYQLNSCSDCLVVSFCYSCVVCQHARELKGGPVWWSNIMRTRRKTHSRRWRKQAMPSALSAEPERQYQKKQKKTKNKKTNKQKKNHNHDSLIMKPLIKQSLKKD